MCSHLITSTKVPLIVSVGTKADFNDILKEMLLMDQDGLINNLPSSGTLFFLTRAPTRALILIGITV